LTLNARKVGSDEEEEMSPRDLKDMGPVTAVEVWYRGKRIR
jgi:hypothetical protein